MNFNFGTPKTTSGLPLTSTVTSVASPGVNFGSGDNKGSTLQAQSAAKTASFGLGFGNTPAAPTSTGFTLGTAASVAPTLSFGSNANFSLGAPSTTTAPVAARTSALTGFGSNVATSSQLQSVPVLTTGGLVAPTTAPLTLGAPTSVATAIPFKLGTAPSTTSAGLTLGSLSTTGQTQSTVVPTTVSGGFTLGKIGTVAVTSAPISTATPALPTAIVSGPSVVASSLIGGLTFTQLEEALNKWTLELEEQGKVFINQALQLNAWDRLVISNGEKILTLNSGIEKVKQQQQQLDHELDFVLAQQRELEDCIIPLEKELKEIPIADHDRNHTYQMAENMDTQLKQMSEDLKEIIEHLNETNKSEDSNDPVAQIGKILNAHMNSLQWIDRSTAQISTTLDQITKMHEMHRRDNERSFHLTYE